MHLLLNKKLKNSVQCFREGNIHKQLKHAKIRIKWRKPRIKPIVLTWKNIKMENRVDLKGSQILNA